MIRVRRYSPLLLLAIAQLVLALAFPSRAPATASAPPPLAITAPGTGDAGADGTAATTDEGGGPAAGGPRTGTAGGSTATGVSAALPGTVNRGGDTRHCVDGRQFGGGLLIVPPCVPTWGDRDNGGATSQGVTRSSIEVVLYRPKHNAAVDAIIQSQGISSSPQQEQDFRDRATQFINTRYELYGRKIHFDRHARHDIRPHRLRDFRNGLGFRLSLARRARRLDGRRSFLRRRFRSVAAVVVFLTSRCHQPSFAIDRARPESS